MPSLDTLFQALGGGALVNPVVIFFFKFMIWFFLSAVMVKLLTILFRDRR